MKICGPPEEEFIRKSIIFSLYNQKIHQIVVHKLLRAFNTPKISLTMLTNSSR